MSIDTLPPELLLKIFSHFSWKELSDSISLVNQRWSQLVSLTNKATLQLSNISDNSCSRCVPMEVLRSSLREYTSFSISLTDMEEQQLSDSFEKVINFCKNRWNMNNLHIKGSIEQIMKFLVLYEALVSELVHLKISIELQTSGSVQEVQTPQLLALSMANLQSLYIYQSQQRVQTHPHLALPLAKSYGTRIPALRHWGHRIPPCILNFTCPNLKTASIQRGSCIRFRLSGGCPKLQSARIIINQEYNHDLQPDDLTSIVAQHPPEFTRVELMNVPMMGLAESLFQNLRQISIVCCTIPTEWTLDCPKLIELKLLRVTLDRPLMLRVPHLKTLICDLDTLGSLNLSGALQAERLVIDSDTFGYPSNYRRGVVRENPTGLSHFRELELRNYQVESTLQGTDRFAFLWQHLRGITKLTVHTDSFDYTKHLQQLHRHLPQITSLCLQGMCLPNSLSDFSMNVETIIIDGCSTYSDIIEISPSIKNILVRRLWNKNKVDAGIQLFLQDRFLPLDATTESIREGNGATVLRSYYSTRETYSRPTTRESEPLSNTLRRIL